MAARQADTIRSQSPNAFRSANRTNCGEHRRFRITNPILVDSKAGIIAGHGRVLAARKLNLEQVPVIVLDHLTETQKRAYIIADNRLALSAGWDEETLALELLELKEADFDLSLTGFDAKELDDLLTSINDEAADVVLARCQIRLFRAQATCGYAGIAGCNTGYSAAVRSTRMRCHDCWAIASRF